MGIFGKRQAVIMTAHYSDNRPKALDAVQRIADRYMTDDTS